MQGEGKAFLICKPEESLIKNKERLRSGRGTAFRLNHILVSRSGSL
jgi:hypothetical protein